MSRRLPSYDPSDAAMACPLCGPFYQPHLRYCWQQTMLVGCAAKLPSPAIVGAASWICLNDGVPGIGNIVTSVDGHAIWRRVLGTLIGRGASHGKVLKRGRGVAERRLRAATAPRTTGIRGGYHVALPPPGRPADSGPYRRAATGTLTRHGARFFQLGDTAEAVGNVAKDAPARDSPARWLRLPRPLI
jgi:hypothetical protein